MKRTYPVLSPIMAGGEKHLPGGSLEFEEKEALELQKIGALGEYINTTPTTETSKGNGAVASVGADSDSDPTAAPPKVELPNTNPAIEANTEDSRQASQEAALEIIAANAGDAAAKEGKPKSRSKAK